jgi:holliday junction DNA helicase RuvA
MIASLTGTLQNIDENYCILEVQGVGYEIETTSLLRQQFQIGDTLTLVTHLVIREDSHALYGFNLKLERDIFRYLIKINGIGPKLGLQIMSYCPPSALLRLVQQQDIAALLAIKGVGKKMAERLLIELKGLLKITATQNLHLPQEEIHTEHHQNRDTLEQALLRLGYKNQQIQAIIPKINFESADEASLIRQALQLLHHPTMKYAQQD